MNDPLSEAPVERPPVTDDCEIVIVGAGFAGLLTTARLREQGFTDIVICEKGGDVGGTWYWNRYPGIACDVESFVVSGCSQSAPDLSRGPNGPRRVTGSGRHIPGSFPAPAGRLPAEPAGNCCRYLRGWKGCECEPLSGGA